MPGLTRRDFINNTSLALIGAAVSSSSAAEVKKTPRLSFTTLGCPDWSLERVINFAAKNGYDEVELRGLLRELDLTKCTEFSHSNIAATKRMVKDSGVKIIGLGTSAHLHDADREKRKTNFTEAKKFIDLAHNLDSSFIRLFPDTIPEGQSRGQTTDLIVQGLRDLATYARDTNVHLLLEPNGDFVKTGDLEIIMKTTDKPRVGVLWNVSMMWASTKEPPSIVYMKLKQYIKHTHIKDLKLIAGKIDGAASFDVLLGQGDVPVGEAINTMYKENYKGSYCCEWEKFWYPAIRDPELALSYFAKQIKNYFTR